MRRVIKGIVMEINQNNATVMTDDGEFAMVKKPSSDIELGQEITSCEYTDSRLHYIKYGALAAAIILMLIPFTYFKQAYATVGYVNVDINPSLEMAINKYNKVNNVVPLNDDAIELTNNIALKGLDINDALDRIITTAKDMGYISGEKENNIEIAIVNLSDKLNISGESLVKQAQKAVSGIDVDATIKVQETDESTHDKAKKENVSTSKYLDKQANSSKETIKVDVKKSDNSGEKNQGKDKDKDKDKNVNNYGDDKNSKKAENGNNQKPKNTNNNGNGTGQDTKKSNGSSGNNNNSQGKKGQGSDKK